MGKCGTKTGGSGGKSSGGGKPIVTPSRPGGNLPSTTGNPSGGGRGNAVKK
jgi:hypothetical protein